MAPSSTQKRKHNIMSLAFEAKQRQAELQEQAANRRAARKASAAKFGMFLDAHSLLADLGVPSGLCIPNPCDRLLKRLFLVEI